MAGGDRFSQEEDELIARCDTFNVYQAAGGTRTQGSWRNRRHTLGVNRQPTPEPVRLPAHIPENVSWREINRHIRGIQEIRHKVSPSNSEANFVFDVNEPIAVICLSDTHIGSIATDHDALERITDEILSIPNLYVGLQGDLLDFAVRLRGVAEVQGNIISSEMQFAYLMSWLEEIAPRIMWATWGNHDVEREEQFVGTSRLGRILADRKLVYFGGIGHADITVGRQLYRCVVSHKFRGRSIYNPVHGAQRYTILQDADRDIAIGGDSHVPGVLIWTHGERTKIAINSGTIQTSSGYAKRYFSLMTHPVFPVLELDPHIWRATPFWSVRDWMLCRGLLVNDERHNDRDGAQQNTSGDAEEEA